VIYPNQLAGIDESKAAKLRVCGFDLSETL
jgi:hypothetical protein